ncbi:MAG TPA: GNAT family protein [Actinomycetota bacterium]
MLKGPTLRLRTVRESDLGELHADLSDLEHRGAFFPLGLQSEPAFRRQFEENGFWGQDEGMLLMVDPHDRVVGEIEFYPITHYLTGYELSYLVFGSEHSGKGYATEAVRLMTAYLFARQRIDRVQLAIHPENEASRRVAQKAGYTFESLMRRCWFHQGRFHDLEIWSMIRDELPPEAGT